MTNERAGSTEIDDEETHGDRLHAGARARGVGGCDESDDRRRAWSPKRAASRANTIRTGHDRTWLTGRAPGRASSVASTGVFGVCTHTQGGRCHAVVGSQTCTRWLRVDRRRNSRLGRAYVTRDSATTGGRAGTAGLEAGRRGARQGRTSAAGRRVPRRHASDGSEGKGARSGREGRVRARLLRGVQEHGEGWHGDGRSRAARRGGQ